MKSVTFLPMNNDIGLLILRLYSGGLMLVAHGWPKLMGLISGNYDKFPDPIGVGPFLSMGLATGAEVFCSLAVVLGLLTRLSVVPLMFTMLVAVFVIHAADPFSKQEFALLYFFPFLVLAFTGAGKYSLDEKFFNKASEVTTD